MLPIGLVYTQGENETASNRVFVSFNTNYGCIINGDSFTNRPITSHKNWGVDLRNIADASAAPVYNANLTLESDLQFDLVEPETDAGYSSPPLYRWSFGNISESWWVEGVGVNFESCDETIEPGFDASRSADKTEFTKSGTQILQIEVIPRQQFVNNHLTIDIRAYPDQFVTPVITSPTTDEAQGIHISEDKHYLIIDIGEPVEDTVYTYEVTLEITLNNGVSNIEFMPEVSVHTNEHYYAGEEVNGDSVSYVMPEVGTWTWNATGSYLWERIYRVVKAVHFGSYSREIINTPPIVKVSIDPYRASVGTVFNFDGSASYDEDGTIVSYYWNFGDDTNGSGETTTHIYKSAGTYTVTLEVTDNNGATANSEAVVTVQDSEEARQNLITSITTRIIKNIILLKKILMELIKSL